MQRLAQHLPSEDSPRAGRHPKRIGGRAEQIQIDLLEIEVRARAVPKLEHGPAREAAAMPRQLDARAAPHLTESARTEAEKLPKANRLELEL